MTWLFEILFETIAQFIVELFYSILPKPAQIGCLLVIAALFAGLILFIFRS